MTLVLGATCLFLYVHMRSSLDGTVDQGLHSRSRDVAALVQQADTGLRDAGAQGAGSGPAQVLDTRGRVFDATQGLGKRPLLTSADLARAGRHQIVVDRVPGLPGEDELRLLATPVRAQDRNLVVVVGSSLEGRDQALTDLKAMLLLGGPIALLLASLAGYGLAAAALRPVEDMRRRAESISTDQLHHRLPLEPARDELRRLGVTLNEMLARLETGVER
jgi:HAMP domain-containing protein